MYSFITDPCTLIIFEIIYFLREIDGIDEIDETKMRDGRYERDGVKMIYLSLLLLKLNGQYVYHSISFT